MVDVPHKQFFKMCIVIDFCADVYLAFSEKVSGFVIGSEYSLTGVSSGQIH